MCSAPVDVCAPPPEQEDIEARGGRPWDTVKPLHKYFNGLGRVLLVDDSGARCLRCLRGVVWRWRIVV